jgi:GNAT superfamily N-acetyltransferase
VSDVVVRRGTSEDIESLVALRVKLQREERLEESSEALQARWRLFFVRGLADDSILPWIATVNDRTVGVAIGYVRPYMPRNPAHDTFEARIHNVFVEAAYRSQGIGRNLVANLIDELRTRSPIRIVLSSTEMARPLYAALGFRPSTELVLKL